MFSILTNPEQVILICEERCRHNRKRASERSQSSAPVIFAMAGGWGRGEEEEEEEEDEEEQVRGLRFADERREVARGVAEQSVHGREAPQPQLPLSGAPPSAHPLHYASLESARGAYV